MLHFFLETESIKTPTCRLNNNHGRTIEAETKETNNVLDVKDDVNHGIASKVNPSPKVEKETAVKSFMKSLP